MPRVLVGMSGGVDSSVAAARLASSGHEVIGVSLQLYDHSGGGRVARCCSPDDFLDARRVAEAFRFPYYVVNREDLFGRKVLDYFERDYRNGRTPNPCVRCNADVKFETLMKMASDLGAAVVATGHYARLDGEPGARGRRLSRARDTRKDQSYFLFDLTEGQRRHAMFPLGEMTKEEVRAEARRLGLAGAHKVESQDICFVEGGDYREFLRARGRAESAGEIVDTSGRVLGRHEGVSGYTVGQRRGLGVSGGRRLYVVDVDAPARRVILGDAEDLLADRLELNGTRLPADGARPFRATVRYRYRHAGAGAWVEPRDGGAAVVRFDEPQRGVSPGQAAVFYDDDLVLGGGWIAGRSLGGSGRHHAPSGKTRAAGCARIGS